MIIVGGLYDKLGHRLGSFSREEGRAEILGRQFVEERTCTVVEALCRGLDESLNDYELSCGHYVVHFVKPSFCVECGARVVE